MTWSLILWLSSSVGALLFFAAGLLAARGRMARHEAALAVLRQEAAGLQAEVDRSQRLSAAMREAGQREDRLRVENTSLRSLVASKDLLEAEVRQLRAANAELLRAQKFPVKAGAGKRLVTVDDPEVSWGHVLQSLVERVSRLGDIRCAVIADDLGLVVASHGELADEVAAVGALFGRAELQAQKVLPLRNVERVTVEDDQGVVLTLRPLRTDHRGEAADLALITLAVGSGPDQRLINQLINEGPKAGTAGARRTVAVSP